MVNTEYLGRITDVRAKFLTLNNEIHGKIE